MWPRATIIAPLTGELLAAAGEKVTKETAAAAEAAGVSLVYLTVDDREVKVFTNGTVDAKEFLSFDPAELRHQRAACSFAELRAILDETENVEEQKELSAQKPRQADFQDV